MDMTIAGVTKTYDSARGSKIALTETSFVIHQSEFVSIVGPSGCGKSTLLMMMAGLLPVSSGSIRMGDTLIDGPAEGLSVVFQEYGRSLFPWMTVEKNLAMAAVAYKFPKAELAERITRALHSVGLEGSEKLYPWQMSGGMQQRVAIARAVVAEPKVLLMDEPFAAVDAQTRADLEDLLRRLWADRDLTVIFVTHDIEEAVYLGQRVLVLSSSPTFVLDDVEVPIAEPRNQATTRVTPEFGALRTRVYDGIQRAKANAKKAAV